MTDRCYNCRGADPIVVGTYGSWIEYRCNIGRDKDKCRKKIRTYKELLTAEQDNKAPKVPDDSTHSGINMRKNYE